MPSMLLILSPTMAKLQLWFLSSFELFEQQDATYCMANMGQAPCDLLASKRKYIMTLKVGINGFGRIGRNVLRGIIESGRTDIEVVAINDLGPVEMNAHLLRFDSVHGRFPATVTVEGNTIDVGTGPIKVTAERDPAKLPWGDVDIALE